MITFVSIDADGTLWDTDAVIQIALEAAVKELGRLVPSAGDLKGLSSGVERTREELIERARSTPLSLNTQALEGISLEAFRGVLADVGMIDPELAEHVTTVFFRHRWAPSVLFPDVIPVLDQLRDRYRLGWLTDGRARPELCGLQKRFEAVVCAPDHFDEKRNGSLFQTLLDLVDCEIPRAAHVGDSLIDDVGGPELIGMRSIWINRDGLPNESELEPAAEIRSLYELPDVLLSLE
ncbi:MAG: HAD family hydrolase [Actinobacteria bacterium]|nr:HAD family hydrolase [Actinomycetota bacterium]